MQSKFWLLLFVSNVMLVSCDTNAIFDEYQTVSNQWHKDSIMNFNVQVPDSITPYNVFVNIRNNNNYKYNNLFLMVEINYPHGKISRDTLEYKMAKPNGELLGTGFTDLKTSKLWYKKNMVFKEKGNYTFKIQQAMRENGKVNGIINLEGVTDIGLRIEKQNNKK